MSKKLTCPLLLVLLSAALVLSGCADRKPMDPDAIATVTTGRTTTVVTTTEEIAAAVDPSGNTVIKLWKDVEVKNAIALPYSCTIDFNGFHIITKAGASNVIEVNKTGEENAVTTLKNGTMEHYGTGILVRGGILVDNMTFYGVSGNAIALSDASFGQAGISAVKNSTFYSYGTSFIHFAQAGGNYQNTDITLENCTIALYRQNGAPIFSKEDASTTPATVIFGENVQMYSYMDTLAEEGFYYAGKMAPISKEPQALTIKDKNFDGLNHWSTENEDTALNLLMIGNSFSYYYVQELYGMAHEAGIEINVTNLYEAGCYVNEHWEWITNEFSGAGKYQFWITNSMGRWRHGQITSSFDALPYLNWDVITLQQHFGGGIKDYEAAKAKCIPYTKYLYDYLKEHYPNADLYWQTTWAYQVGHDSMPTKEEQILKQNNIIKLSQELADESSVSIIPSGQAWQIARENPVVGDKMCKSDKYHDGDTGGGQYLNACVWLEVLTGKSCIGNTWRPNYALDESKIEALQQAAHQAVAAIYGSDYAK